MDKPLILALHNAAPRLLAATKLCEELREALAQFIKTATDNYVPGYIGNADGWECGQCAAMDGSGKAPTTAEVIHEDDCFQGGLEKVRAALAKADAVLGKKEQA